MYFNKKKAMPYLIYREPSVLEHKPIPTHKTKNYNNSLSSSTIELLNFKKNPEICIQIVRKYCNKCNGYYPCNL